MPAAKVEAEEVRRRPRSHGDQRQEQDPHGRGSVDGNHPTHSLCLPTGWNISPPCPLCCQAQAGVTKRKAAYLRVVDTQGLDLVKGKQDTDKEHFVLFLKG